MLKPDYSKQTELFEPGNLIVQFCPGFSLKDSIKIHSLAGATLIEQIPELNIDIIEVENGKEIEYMNKYLSYNEVCNVELNYYMTPDFFPNDSFYSTKTQTSQDLQCQWGLSHIMPEAAWDITHTITPTVVIAIIDTGIDSNHPDLVSKIVNPVNFSTSDQADYSDSDGHGTAVAGITAAVTDNRIGIAGTSFNTANIMPIKALTVIAAIKGIIYAVNHSAKVINMSQGFYSYSIAFQNAVNYAWNNGIVFIASAGNDGRDQIQYPAGYNHVLAVSATDKSNSLTEFSNWGLNIGIAAPGVDILTTTPTYSTSSEYLINYDAVSGTSPAAAFVSGVAAMMFSVNPTLTNQEIIQIIEQTAEPLEVGSEYYYNNAPKAWNPFWGYGLLNAGSAVLLARRYFKRREGLGSFYGQIVDRQTILPVGNALAVAIVNKTVEREYLTKTNISLDSTSTADGMFRLMNLRKETYSIAVCLPNQSPHIIQTAEIVPGADTFLRLLV